MLDERQDRASTEYFDAPLRALELGGHVPDRAGLFAVGLEAEVTGDVLDVLRVEILRGAAVGAVAHTLEALAAVSLGEEAEGHALVSLPGRHLGAARGWRAEDKGGQGGERGKCG